MTDSESSSMESSEEDFSRSGGESDSADEFEESAGSKGTSDQKQSEVKNLPYDEALELSASQSMAEPSKGGDGALGQNSIRNKPFDEAMSVDSDEGEDSLSTNPSPRMAPVPAPAPAPAPRADPAPMQAKGGGGANSDSEESSSEEESSSDEEGSGAVGVAAVGAAGAAAGAGGGGGGGVAGGYDPKDMEHLQVSAEIRELFQYIQRYKPQDIELESKIKCFIPDYVPSVGQIDAFLKVPRPDGQPSTLGLSLLDEPASNQSDSTVLDLQIRAVSKRQHGDAAVRSIENAHKDKAAVQRWIDNLTELHRSKPLPQVNYTKNMPEIELLMQVWPEEIEEVIKTIDLPGVDMDIGLEDYVSLVCNVMDVPVYKNKVESLHVLFTLFSEFNANQHFMNMPGGHGAAGGGGAEAKGGAEAADPNYDFGAPYQAEAKGAGQSESMSFK